jgi:hypothetical protein
MFEIIVWVLLTIPPAVGRVEVGKEEKMKRNYARLCFCKNSRRLREASTEKTVSREMDNKATIISMPV